MTTPLLTLLYQDTQNGVRSQKNYRHLCVALQFESLATRWQCSQKFLCPKSAVPEQFEDVFMSRTIKEPPMNGTISQQTAVEASPVLNVMPFMVKRSKFQHFALFCDVVTARCLSNCLAKNVSRVLPDSPGSAKLENALLVMNGDTMIYHVTPGLRSHW